MASAAQLQRLTPTDRRIEQAIKAINRRTGRPASMTAICAALNFIASVATVRRGIWRLEDAGLVYRYSVRSGYYAGTPPARVSTRQQPLLAPEAERHVRWLMATDTPPRPLPRRVLQTNETDIATRQTELRLLVEVGRQPAEPTKPPSPTKRHAPPSDAPTQLALPIADAA